MFPFQLNFFLLIFTSYSSTGVEGPSLDSGTSEHLTVSVMNFDNDSDNEFCSVELTKVCDKCKCGEEVMRSQGMYAWNPDICASRFAESSEIGFFSWLENKCIFSASCPETSQVSSNKAWAIYRYSQVCVPHTSTPTWQYSNEARSCTLNLIGSYRKCNLGVRFIQGQTLYSPEACVNAFSAQQTSSIQSGFFSMRENRCIPNSDCPEDEQVSTDQDWQLYSYECRLPSPTSIPTIEPTLRPSLYLQGCTLTLIGSYRKCNKQVSYGQAEGGHVSPESCALSFGINQNRPNGFFSMRNSHCVYSQNCPLEGQTETTLNWIIYSYECSINTNPPTVEPIILTLLPTHEPTQVHDPTSGNTYISTLEPSTLNLTPTNEPTQVHDTTSESHTIIQSTSEDPQVSTTQNYCSNIASNAGCTFHLVGQHLKCKSSTSVGDIRGSFHSPEACVTRFGVLEGFRTNEGFFSMNGAKCVYHEECPENERFATSNPWSLYFFQCPGHPTSEATEPDLNEETIDSVFEENGCLNWCHTQTSVWDRKCSFSECNGCSSCIPDLVEETVETVPEEEQCVNWCATHTAVWNRKCNFSECNGCTNCIPDLVEETVETVTEEEQCMDWCNAHTDVWKRKCNLSECNGCTHCIPSLSPTTTPTTGQCLEWCPEHTQSWRIKCTYSMCNACSQCSKRPNILLIFADDVGTGDVPGYWGNTNSGVVDMPNIYDLVTKGVTFTDAHAELLCAPSRYALLSGTPALRGRSINGMWTLRDRNAFLPDQKTLPQVLQESGNYDTFMAGKWHLGGGVPRNGNLDREHYLTSPSHDWTQPIVEGPTDIGFSSSYITSEGIQNTPYAFFRDGYLESDVSEVRWWDEGVYTTANGISEILKEGEGDPNWDSSRFNQIVASETISFLNEHAMNRPDDPFFAYVALGATHEPFTPPNMYFDQTTIAGTYPEPFFDILYEMDLVVGSLVNALEERQLMEDTIVIFLSDNGGLNTGATKAQPHCHYSNGPLRSSKGSILEGGHRVPLIMRYDHVFPAGETRSHLLSITDMFATICDLANVPLPEGQALDSISFSEYIISDNPTGLRQMMGHWRSEGNFIIREALRWKQYKLLLFHEGDLHGHDTGSMFLYDLEQDITEATDLSDNPEYADMINSMLEHLWTLRGNAPVVSSSTLMNLVDNG